MQKDMEKMLGLAASLHSKEFVQTPAGGYVLASSYLNRCVVSRGTSIPGAPRSGISNCPQGPVACLYSTLLALAGDLDLPLWGTSP